MTQPTKPPAGDPPANPSTAPPADPTEPARDEPLGEGGKKALDAEREARKAAEKEAAKYKSAAAEAQAEALRKITEAFGLGEEQVDPAELARQLADHQTAAAIAQMELQVYRTAARLGADPDRLLDSRTFTIAVNDLPDEDFETNLETLIKQWVDRDQNLRPEPSRPRPDPSQGARGPTDIDALIRDAETKGNVREAIRLKNQKLHAK